MLTDGTEERQFLYAEDCCEALETIMECYSDFKPSDPLHPFSHPFCVVCNTELSPDEYESWALEMGAQEVGFRV